MTIITEPYIPYCAAHIEITLPPNNTLLPPPRKVNVWHVILYALHPLAVVIGFIPVILLGWLGFIFLQYPHTFGQFVYYTYLILPFVVQVTSAIVRGARAYWFMKYGVHGYAKLTTDPVGLVVIDAATQTKVLDLGVQVLQQVPESTSEEFIILYSQSRPSSYLSLIPYKNTFSIRMDSLRVRPSVHVALAVFTTVVLFVELIIVATVPMWSGIRMIPS